MGRVRQVLRMRWGSWKLCRASEQNRNRGFQTSNRAVHPNVHVYGEPNMTQSRHTRNSIGIREIARGWPLIVVVMMIAVGAAMWTESRQVRSYTATTRVEVVPLPQWDETFLGINLVRDSGDATRTAATVAAELNSTRAATVTADYLGGGWTLESVAAAVKVSSFEQTNVVEIVARAASAEKAVKLSQAYATATLADRWQSISAQLDGRIAKIQASVLANPAGNTDNANANPIAAQQVERLQTLRMIRESGADPTMRIESTGSAVASKQLPTGVVLALAATGGLFVGSLAAAGMAVLRRPANHRIEQSPFPALALADPPNGESRNDLEPV